VEELVSQPLMYETSQAVAAATAILEKKESKGSLQGASPTKPRGHSTTMAKRS